MTILKINLIFIKLLILIFLTPKLSVAQKNIWKITEKTGEYDKFNPISSGFPTDSCTIDTIISGKIVNYGQIKFLHNYCFISNDVYFNRINFSNPPDDSCDNKWVKITCKITFQKKNVNSVDELILHIINLEILSFPEKDIESGLNEAKKAIDLNKSHFNLNLYKKTQRYKVLINRGIKNSNLNKLPYYPDFYLLSYDLTNKKMCINCGKYVLFSSSIIRYYLSEYAIYDVTLGKITEIRIVNTGEKYE